MSVQDALNDFGSKVGSLKASDVVVDTRKVELDGAEVALNDANVVQHDAKVAAKVSFDAVLAEVALLDLDSVEVPVEPKTQFHPKVEQLVPLES